MYVVVPMIGYRYDADANELVIDTLPVPKGQSIRLVSSTLEPFDADVTGLPRALILGVVPTHLPVPINCQVVELEGEEEEPVAVVREELPFGVRWRFSGYESVPQLSGLVIATDAQEDELYDE